MDELFGIIENRRGTHRYALWVTMVEIYNEKIRDLLGGVRLGKETLDALEGPRSASGSGGGVTVRKGKHGMYLDGAQEVAVRSAAEVEQVMAAGNASRATASTNANAQSSRSHSVLMIRLEGAEVGADSAQQRRTPQWHGKLVMVDLAGSERLSKTAASGERLVEAKHINKSLSACSDPT